MIGRNSGKLNGTHHSSSQSHGSINARGVAILLRSGFDCKIIKQSYVDPAGRYIGIQAQINDENYYLFNVYAPNNDNQAAQFYDHLLAVLKKEDLAYEDRWGL